MKTYGAGDATSYVTGGRSKHCDFFWRECTEKCVEDPERFVVGIRHRDMRLNISERGARLL